MSRLTSRCLFLYSPSMILVAERVRCWREFRYVNADIFQVFLSSLLKSLALSAPVASSIPCWDLQWTVASMVRHRGLRRAKPALTLHTTKQTETSPWTDLALKSRRKDHSLHFNARPSAVFLERAWSASKSGTSFRARVLATMKLIVTFIPGIAQKLVVLMALRSPKLPLYNSYSPEWTLV